MNLDQIVRPWRGAVLDIFIASEVGAPMEQIEEASAIAGRGIEGDRYFKGNGFYSWYTGPLREISLIEVETLDALAAVHNLDLAPGETRRNITTRGVPLNHLVGRRFRVGDAILRGVELCEPCKHLVDLTGKQPILSALIHRGGLHAEIVQSGIIRPGDPIEEIP